MSDQTQPERRRDFLAGEGTLTAQEVVEWAQELGRGSVSLPAQMKAREELMVAVVHRGLRTVPSEAEKWRIAGLSSSGQSASQAEGRAFKSRRPLVRRHARSCKWLQMRRCASVFLDTRTLRSQSFRRRCA